MADAKFFSKYSDHLQSTHLTLPSSSCLLFHPPFTPIAQHIARGKTQELREELRQANDKRDKGFTRKKVALKKIVANMTMGNDSMSMSRLTSGLC